MSRRVRFLFAVVLPALAVCLSTSARGPSEEDAEAKAAAARNDLLRLADSLDRDEDEIEKQARAIAANHGLGAVMWSLKLRELGGVGVGPTPGAILPDGVELKLLVLGKKPLTAKELETQRDDLIGMAKVSLAVSRAVPYYAAQGAGPGKFGTKREWILYSDGMKTASQDLMDALKGDDAKAAAAAAGRLNRSCNDCHGTGFR